MWIFLRATDVLMIFVGDAGSVLVHAHDGGTDHLHRRVIILNLWAHALGQPWSKSWLMRRCS
jgi:hypothetical protein